MSEVNDLETLLRQRRDLSAKLSRPSEALNSGSEMIKADKTADLDDFIEMVANVVSKCMRNPAVIFQPDEGARLSTDQSTKIDCPYIFYQLISRTPKKELKPREREEFHERIKNSTDARAGRIYGQKYICLVQFNILANDYKHANQVAKDFEDLMFRYTSYFKKNGVAEIIFQRQFTDNDLDMYRQSMSIRSLQYYIEIEKLYVVYASEFLDTFMTN